MQQQDQQVVSQVKGFSYTVAEFTLCATGWPVPTPAFKPVSPVQRHLAQSQTMTGNGAAGIATVVAAGVEVIRDAHSENTRRAYKSDLRAFRKWGGDVPTTPEELARYIAEEGQRLHPSTVLRCLAALSVAHRLSSHAKTGFSPAIRMRVRTDRD